MRARGIGRVAFNSVHYLIFFPMVAALFFTLPHRYRWVLLLAASYVFYMAWEPLYIVLILASTCVDYLVARAIRPGAKGRRNLAYLLCSLTANLGLLFTFKYFNFALSALAGFFPQYLPQLEPLKLHVLLPVGISFYTFQTLSYTIEVYWGKISATRHVGRFALYVAFFPQLVAGPIERPSNLLPQFEEKKTFDYDRAVSGLRLILWGMFKKTVVADNMALIVDTVYGDTENFAGPARKSPISLAATFGSTTRMEPGTSTSQLVFKADRDRGGPGNSLNPIVPTPTSETG